ncbi:MAG: hypothetical protein JWR44_436 [Hymenobacter sp.]|jgi:hypothetical protein|nr:hypothetical protein [Hymenobacter sp.]
MNWLTSRCAPLAVLAALALAGCDKGTDLNVDLPDTTAISTEYKDLPVDAATVRIAPVQTLKADHFLVGRLADNIAGNTEARAYLNLVVDGANDSLPSKLTTPVLDSVVLVMGFDKVDGSTSVPVRFDVSNLAAPLDEREPYTSTSVTATAPTPLGQNLTSRLDRTTTITTTAATATSPAVTTTSPDRTVRLVLQRSAAVSAPFAPSPAVSSPFFSTTFFTALRTTSFGQTQLNALLKGLAITPSAGYSSAIVNFGRSYNARLAFFYHDDAVVVVAPARRPWRSYSIFMGPVYSSLGASSSRDPRYYTQIINDLASTPLSPLSDVTQAVPTAATSGTSYLQEGTGLGTRITFLGLNDLMASAAAGALTVNRAELRIPVKPYSNALFANPANVYALEVGPGNAILQRTANFLPSDRLVQADGADQLGVSNPSVAGLVDGQTTQPYYRMLVTSYLQSYLGNKLGGNPTSLVLIPNMRRSLTLSLNRTAIDANNIRLRVYYSKR